MLSILCHFHGPLLETRVAQSNPAKAVLSAGTACPNRLDAIAFLNGPMQNVQIAELRKLYKFHQRTGSVPELITEIDTMQTAFGPQSKNWDRKGTSNLACAQERGFAVNLLRHIDWSMSPKIVGELPYL